MTFSPGERARRPFGRKPGVIPFGAEIRAAWRLKTDTVLRRARNECGQVRARLHFRVLRMLNNRTQESVLPGMTLGIEVPEVGDFQEFYADLKTFLGGWRPARFRTPAGSGKSFAVDPYAPWV